MIGDLEPPSEEMVERGALVGNSIDFDLGNEALLGLHDQIPGRMSLLQVALAACDRILTCINDGPEPLLRTSTCPVAMSAKVDPTHQGFHKGFHDPEQVDHLQRGTPALSWRSVEPPRGVVPGPTHYEGPPQRLPGLLPGTLAARVRPQRPLKTLFDHIWRHEWLHDIAERIYP
jgi:hypothetical protein